MQCAHTFKVLVAHRSIFSRTVYDPLEAVVPYVYSQLVILTNAAASAYTVRPPPQCVSTQGITCLPQG